MNIADGDGVGCIASGGAYYYCFQVSMSHPFISVPFFDIVSTRYDKAQSNPKLNTNQEK